MYSRISPVNSTDQEGGNIELNKEFNNKNEITVKKSFVHQNATDDHSKSKFEQFRLDLKNFLLTSILGHLYEIFMLVISLLSTLQYIYETYLTTSYQDQSITAVFVEAELAVACLFLFDWSLNVFIADNKIKHIRSFFSMVDLMTVLPIFVLYINTCVSIIEILTIFDGFMYFLCGLKTTRILRSLRLRKWFLFIEDEVQKFLSILTLTIVVMILFNAALMQYLEKEDQPYSFHTWTYYMLVTVTTVGYGDIFPVTTLGRFAAMGMISFAIITVPKMTNELIEKMNAQSIYQR
eukprot:gene16936-23250_t